MRDPFRYFNSSPEVIRLAVMMYIRYPLSLRQVEDLLFERGIDICHETVRFWWNRFGSMFAAELRRRRAHRRSYSRWRWHLDEVFVRINVEIHYLWRAVDQRRRSARGLRDEASRSWGRPNRRSLLALAGNERAREGMAHLTPQWRRLASTKPCSPGSRNKASTIPWTARKTPAPSIYATPTTP